MLDASIQADRNLSLPVSPRYAFRRTNDQDVPVLTDEHDLAQAVRRIAVTIKKVLDTNDVIFQLPRRMPTRLADLRGVPKRLILFIAETLPKLQEHFASHRFNPYIELLVDAVDAVQAAHAAHAAQAVDAVQAVEVARKAQGLVLQGLLPVWHSVIGEAAKAFLANMNHVVAELRQRGATASFQKRLDGCRRRCGKNQRSLLNYINAIFAHRGNRHLVLRLDLAYAPQEAWVTFASLTCDQAREHMEKFIRHVRESLALKGYAWKLEYGLLKGYHFHVLIFLNGHLHQEDITIARRLGEHWKSVITEGRGVYWTCNAQAYEQRGVGMIGRDDYLKRAVLERRVAHYLTKTDFWLTFSPGGKTFARGVMPEPPPRADRRAG